MTHDEFEFDDIVSSRNPDILMDCFDAQLEIERHKMTILVGLTNLKRSELTSCEHVLEVLYGVFTTELKPSQYSLGQVAVLISGMGLVSDTARIAFYIAINQYCATIIQQLHGEVHSATNYIYDKELD